MKKSQIATTMILLAGIVIWLMYITQLANSRPAWGTPGFSNASIGNTTGWDYSSQQFKVASGNLLDLLVQNLGLVTAAAGILGIAAVVVGTIFPNPYIIFAGVAFFIYSMFGVVKVMVAASGLPAFLGDMIVIFLAFLMAIDVISWLKGGGLP